jgi:hypothetical protein
MQIQKGRVYYAVPTEDRKDTIWIDLPAEFSNGDLEEVIALCEFLQSRLVNQMKMSND